FAQDDPYAPRSTLHAPRLASHSLKFVEARPGPTLQPATEILNALLAGAVADALRAREDPVIDALVAGQRRRGIAGARHPELRLFDVALLQRAVDLRVLGKGAGETIRRRLVVVRL